MNRREYLASVGLGAGSGAIVLRPTWPAGRSSTGSVRIRPARSEFPVEQETTVLFEAGVPDALEPHEVAWDVDGDLAGGVFFDGYAAYAGTASLSATFESRGTRSVRATYPADGGTVTWTIHVDADGAGRPLLSDLTTRPGEGDVIGVPDSVEIAARVSDPHGRLDRVLFQEGRNETEVFAASVSGSEDTATYVWEEAPHWFPGGYPTAAVVVTEDGRVSDVHFDHGPDVRPPFEVEIVDTNDPVTAGNTLEVLAAIEHTGTTYLGDEDTQEIVLSVGTDTERVDAVAVTLGGNSSERVALGYETYPVERDVSFPIRVESSDFADERRVEVLAAESALGVTIVDANDPVGAGDVLEVTALVENTGTETTTQEVKLLVGDDPEEVDRATVTVEPGESGPVTLGYETYPVEQDVRFPIRVETDDDGDERTVDVLAAGGGGDTGGSTVSVSILSTTAPVTGGAYLGVTVRVRNAGSGRIDETIRLVVGGEQVDATALSLEPGDATTITLGYETYPVQQDVSVTLQVESTSTGAADHRTVPVSGTN